MADDHGDQKQRKNSDKHSTPLRLDQSDHDGTTNKTNQSCESINFKDSMPSTSDKLLKSSKPPDLNQKTTIGLIDPSELQSTSRSNVNLQHLHLHHNVDISPCSSSSKSSPIRLEDNCLISSGTTNKHSDNLQRQKVSSGKKAQKNKAKNNSMLTIMATNVNDILEIERINIEDDGNDDRGQGRLDDEDENDDMYRLNPQLDRSNRSTSSNNIDYLLSLLPPSELNEMPYEDPIQIRGNGNITLFGLSNCYTSTFPSALLGRVSKEEFEYTMNRINQLLQQQHSTNAKFLLLGCLCCCFSLGCSLLWPTFALSRRTKNSLEKLLAMENSRLYNKLGLNWRLSKQPSHTNHSFMEYILVIDFLPKMHIYQPD